MVIDCFVVLSHVGINKSRNICFNNSDGDVWVKQIEPSKNTHCIDCNVEQYRGCMVAHKVPNACLRQEPINGTMNYPHNVCTCNAEHEQLSTWNCKCCTKSNGRICCVANVRDGRAEGNDRKNQHVDKLARVELVCFAAGNGCKIQKKLENDQNEANKKEQHDSHVASIWKNLADGHFVWLMFPAK